MTVNEKIERTYNALKKVLGWTVDKRVTLSLAGYYVTLEREFNEKRYNEISTHIKKSVGMFNPLRSHLHPLFVSTLDVSDMEPKQAVDLLIEKTEALKAASFKINSYAYLAALMMSEDKENWSGEIKRAEQLMADMKKHHRFLTSTDDYPYAMFLGKLEGDTALRAETMNRYYKQLKDYKFYAGNELQWMSQVLTYTSPNYEESLIQRAVIIRDGLKTVKIKTSAPQYPIIGFMAALKLEEDQLNEIVTTYESIANMKLFSWYKESALPIAFGLSLRSSKDIYATAAISMATSLELILQAQQAMMISTIAATSVAASSGTN
ncbi:DUF4003 family protein [Psychrobacillus sp. NEAU-3TGS]|uniref:DUF4003 family protein n=1 Tax=Psychrobacillus sp. NEAU-3TGS TaxID=2995412 RepID=UPI002499646D|nr:DUF4003 family protein [Psychrobacillus sp. NEAU-3TGS]MDI2586338.1 DUF4003 family protein [Psychrobacillus sp. NEAU-3TGS]